MARLNHLALLGAAALPACAPQPDRAEAAAGVNVMVGGRGTDEAPCFVEAEGRRLTSDAFAAAARQWRQREVHLWGEARTPYRCMGPIIFALQSAGVQRIGFISEPEPTPQTR